MCRLGQHLPGFLGSVENAFGMVDKDLAVGSQRYRARGPVEQLDAEIALERLDSLGRVGWRQIEFGAGLADRPERCHAHEQVEILQIKSHIYSPASASCQR